MSNKLTNGWLYGTTLFLIVLGLAAAALSHYFSLPEWVPTYFAFGNVWAIGWLFGHRAGYEGAEKDAECKAKGHEWHAPLFGEPADKTGVCGRCGVYAGCLPDEEESEE